MMIRLLYSILTTPVMKMLRMSLLGLPHLQRS
jgi:hypothetical protein